MPAVVQVAVPVPVRRLFDYLVQSGPVPPCGVRVRVPFGKRELVGLVMAAAGSHVTASKLRPIDAVLDATPVVDDELTHLYRWTADYYHHPIGEVVANALPVRLRAGAAAALPVEEKWALTDAGRTLSPATFARAPVQGRLFAALLGGARTAEDLQAVTPRWRPAMQALAARGWVAVTQSAATPTPPIARMAVSPPLSAAQAEAIAAVAAAHDRFGVHLLHGVTGSGKTEVYLAAAAAVIARGRQVLLLVPEIGLTPQLLDRLRARLAVPISVLHSGLNESERLQGWLNARSGAARLIVGTRSAVFAPAPELGLIVVDEEHDGSYKQQDGLRYHARDVAIVRASARGIPIVLGSATPSLESLHNAQQGRYATLTLASRAGAAQLPPIHLLDMRKLAERDGLSHPLLDAVGARLAAREQSLLFINRRGFAPVMLCRDCGWLAPCARCDARLIWHRGIGRLRCHHCGADTAAPTQCSQCQGSRLIGVGAGTQRVEAALAARFPTARVVRIDRDTTARKGELQAQLARVNAGDADILVGTQMLAKGHDFPRVTLVGVLDADHGLYGMDFRAGEQLFAQILQVAGRAGRGPAPGQVLVQTFHPDHNLFAALQGHDYAAYAAQALRERAEAGYPPFSHLALLRAEALKPSIALGFLIAAAAQAQTVLADETDTRGVQVWEPVASPMERRAGRYRAQLLVQAAARPPLHRFLAAWLAELEALPAARRVRWSLDVDPLSLY